MQFDHFLNKKVTISQVKSGLKLTARTKGNLIGLGLRGIGSSVEVVVNAPTLGMIKKVGHLLKIN
jgi:ribosomal protein L30/L7E